MGTMVGMLISTENLKKDLFDIFLFHRGASLMENGVE